jgi:hypothetical protein
MDYIFYGYVEIYLNWRSISYDGLMDVIYDSLFALNKFLKQH